MKRIEGVQSRLAHLVVPRWLGHRNAFHAPAWLFSSLSVRFLHPLHRAFEDPLLCWLSHGTVRRRGFALFLFGRGRGRRRLRWGVDFRPVQRHQGRRQRRDIYAQQAHETAV